jgi:transposase-like protein
MKKANKNNEKKQQAQFLYMSGNKTQKEIADMIGVRERSVHSWIHQYAWDKLRLAAFQAPVTIADNLAAQVVELQNVIAAREVGNRFPTPQEAEVSRKILTSWERMKKYPSLSQSMQVLETFRNYIRPIDKDFARDLGKYIKDFVEAKAINGYAPYQVEYGVEPVSPVLPFYDEVEGLDANDTKKALCPDHLTCLYPGKCNYPYCMKEKEREVTVDDYKVSPVLFTRNNPQKTEVAPAATGSNPAVPTFENRKNIISANPQITLATGSNPAIHLSQELGLKGSPPEQGPAFSAGGAEGFNFYV